MKCSHCRVTVTNEEQGRVADSFDEYDDLCFACAEAAWTDLQQSLEGCGRPCQDEGDNP